MADVISVGCTREVKLITNHDGLSPVDVFPACDASFKFNDFVLMLLLSFLASLFVLPFFSF